MSERTRETVLRAGAAQSALEQRSRRLFEDSVDGLDMRLRSRLTRARHAALDAATASHRRPWLVHMRAWTPAASVASAVLLGAALWFALPLGNHGMLADSQAGLEDLDIIAASSDGGSGDAMDMLQNDLDFYDFAEKAASPEPAA